MSDSCLLIPKVLTDNYHDNNTGFISGFTLYKSSICALKYKLHIKTSLAFLQDWWLSIFLQEIKIYMYKIM